MDALNTHMTQHSDRVRWKQMTTIEEYQASAAQAMQLSWYALRDQRVSEYDYHWITTVQVWADKVLNERATRSQQDT
jgi:hypothetical protein